MATSETESRLFTRPAVEDVRWQDPEEGNGSEEDVDEEGCIPDEEILDGSKIYLPGSVRCSDGLDFSMSSEDWDLESVEETLKEGLETDGETDGSTATVVASLTDKWEEEEAQVERRRNRRRKQSAEAALELDRHRSNQHR